MKPVAPGFAMADDRIVAVSTPPVADPATRGRVLLVDDDPVSRRALRHLLVGDGFDVTEVGDADAAMAALQCGAFDALVTDDSMPPGRRGLHLAADAAARWPDLTCIVASGSGPPAEVAEALVWLEKPVDVDLLVAVLDRRSSGERPKA